LHIFSPASAVKHLRSSLSRVAASVQSNFNLDALAGDGDVFAVLAVVNAPAAV